MRFDRDAAVAGLLPDIAAYSDEYGPLVCAKSHGDFLLDALADLDGAEAVWDALGGLSIEDLRGIALSAMHKRTQTDHGWGGGYETWAVS